MAEKTLTHLDPQGAAQMVDVGAKPVTARCAVAEGWIVMAASTLQMIEQRAHKKGEVLSVARIAGIMAAKRTAELIPLCHSLRLTRIEVELHLDQVHHAVKCTATVETQARTGVEIEALCAVQVSLLTIYDMCKAVDRGMRMQDIQLLHKRGGQSGEWQRPDTTT